ncbi:phosphatase [Hydrocoleum sp. CS-953]|uniref:PhoX family protein n=1 Tax=Hydrocoleum sp. CS-953 TaxID=1671698 RepID=UPI000B9B91C4|nr:alkaline phosphatase PhoX [Hydrocoleum sp. CS-953]OZH55776.1 phosphatase [Hydrocoleum sp. CS-953]
MNINRREFLLFLGASAGTFTLSSCQQKSSTSLTQTSPVSTNSTNNINFQPVKSPMPLATTNQEFKIDNYTTYEVVDDLVIPEGFTYDIIGSWGDKIGDSRFGYNNDYLSYIETGENEGLLTINFEYISALTWITSYEKVIGKSLPFLEIAAAFQSAVKSGVNTQELLDKSSLKKQIITIAKEAMIDMGIGVISIRREPDGKWVRTNSKFDRRITGISGLEDGRYLKSTGPAVAVFNKKGKGYDDKLGDKIIGSFANCAGGTTPWGTVFSAEENFQAYVIEAVYSDGTSVDPTQGNSVFIGAKGVVGLGSAFGLAGNKYGWMVEVDPANPDDYGTKHTWLGRYRHEAVGIRAEANQPLAFYSGCDRRSGHLYKFVSKDIVKDPTDKSNSQLLTNGMLYGAKFNSDGTGSWIPLKEDTPINPDLPSVHVNGMINLPQRPEGGSFKATKDREIEAFKQKYKTLGDLYEGDAEAKQGTILIDAHLAANAAGVTCAARPEDTQVAKDGSLFIAFTSGYPSSSDGSPDKRIFKGRDGAAYEYGWIMRLVEDGDRPDAMTFRWQMFATGGEPTDGGLGFSNPDNLEFDPQGNLWMVTDMSTSKHNKAVPENRMGKDDKPMNQSSLCGLFGNNSIWYIPTSGPNAGEAYLFGIGPTETETCGPFFTKDGKTLFVAIQHPGEYSGIRQNMASETRQFAMKTTDGSDFMQNRTVPIGSNWPTKKVNDPPKPSVVAIRRLDSTPII